ncbi:MAG TPA: hypothetical protein PL169_15155, partial [Leptospiraceae bacterium]|nr:hypothetical protein [Leptospiraceae bacterium]
GNILKFIGTAMEKLQNLEHLRMNGLKKSLTRLDCDFTTFKKLRTLELKETELPKGVEAKLKIWASKNGCLITFS